MQKHEAPALFSFWEEQKEKWNIDYGLAINQHKRSFGLCSYRHKTIYLSVYHLKNSPIEHVQNTILHEIAHVKAGPFAGHNIIWKNWAIRVGATPERCGNYENVMPKGRFLLQCTNCVKILRRAHRRSNLSRRYCRECGIDSLGLLQWIDKLK